MSERAKPRISSSRSTASSTTKTNSTLNEANLLIKRHNKPKTNDPKEWAAYWQAVGQVWRVEPEISPKRQEELNNYQARITETNNVRYPFKDVKLSRADVEWLLAKRKEKLKKMHRTDMSPNEQGLDLRGANLSGEDLSELPLEYLQGGLSGKEWENATQEQQNYAAICLEGAILNRTHLQGACLCGAYLGGAKLNNAHLEGAKLNKVHLEWEENPRHILPPIDLRGVFFDDRTDLEGITLSNEVPLVDVHWGGCNLSVIGWKSLKILGDEYEAQQLKQLNAFEKAVRANRQLAVALRDQGLNEEASHYAYRTQVLQRRVIIQQALQRKQKLRLLRILLLVVIFFPPVYEGLGFLLPTLQLLSLPLLILPLLMFIISMLPSEVWFEVRLLRMFLLLLLLLPIPFLPIFLLVTQLSPVIITLTSNVSSVLHLQFFWVLLLLLISIILLLAYPPRQMVQKIVRRISFFRDRSIIAPYIQFGLSLFLDLLAGYGYKPLRSVTWYIIAILGFALAYYEVGVTNGPLLNWNQALIISLTAFHGRGFLFNQPQPSNPFAVVAAIEAMIGLIIEISFIATFTQRYFGK